MLAATVDRVVNYGGVTRLLGSRPMDEAVALQALYREKRYEAMDKARIERLGEVVKSKLYNNDVPTDEEYQDFMQRYARSGGRIETFNQAYMRWTKDANQSVVNQMLRKHENPFSQKLFEIMGGEPLSE
jgi:chromosome segregation and condensation protein ScpB